MSSGNGHILFGYPICVDYWMNIPGEKYFRFLTHLHSDHTVGLKSTFREKIYTSHINKWLLTKWFNIDPNQVTAIDIGHNLLLGNTDDSGQPFVVTLIDANHCPGSVMFLFQGHFGNILYTGDFRYYPDMLTNYPMLKSLVEIEALDSLYLDNTFAADHCEFPQKEELAESIFDVIRSHPDHYIIIGTRKLGKEEIIRKIGLELKEKVCVSQDRFELLTFLQFEEVFTTNHNDSRIFIVSIPLVERYKKTLQEQKGPVIIIILSAFYYQASKSKLNNHKDVYFFPYSDHSSHSELEIFVSKVKPHSIYPIVSSGNVPTTTRASAGFLVDLINSHLETSGRDSVIPQSILRYSKHGNKQDAFKERSNVFPTLQPKPHSLKLSMEESSNLCFNADNTHKNNKIRLKKALIRENNNTSMDSMSSECTIIADLISSDENIQPDDDKCNPSTSQMISNKMLTRDKQSHMIPRDLEDDLFNTSSSKYFSNDATLTEVNGLKENESFVSKESDQDFYPLSQEEFKQRKSAEDCKSHKKERIDNNRTNNIVVQIPYSQSCEIKKGVLEGQTRLKLCENTNEMSDKRSEVLSLTGSYLACNDYSSEKIREDMEVNFEISKTHDNMSLINSNPTENSETDGEASFSLLKSNDHEVSTDHFNQMPLNKYDKEKFSFKCIHHIPFTKKIDQVLQNNFLHALETWENSIGRNTSTD